jgi:hypothetical protein
MRVLWLIYLDLVMLAEKWFAAEFILARNVRFTSASIALHNYKPNKKK